MMISVCGDVVGFVVVVLRVMYWCLFELGEKVGSEDFCFEK